MSKQVQIDRDLLVMLYKYFNNNDNLNSFDALLIRDKVNDKFQKVINHILFEKYKRAVTDEERREALSEYLDNVNQ